MTSREQSSRALRANSAYEGDLLGALEDCNAALQIDPASDDALAFRAVVHLGREDYDHAIADLSAAITLNGERYESYRDRGLAWFRKRDFQRAIDDVRQALLGNPRDAIALNNRGAARIEVGDYRNAIVDLQSAIQLDPAIASPHKHLAWVLAACPDATLRDGTQAIVEATRALELVGWMQDDWLATLAAAHADAGNYGEAVLWQQEVLAAADADQQEDLHGRLMLYASGAPYRLGVVHEPSKLVYDKG